MIAPLGSTVLVATNTSRLVANPVIITVHVVLAPSSRARGHHEYHAGAEATPIGKLDAYSSTILFLLAAPGGEQQKEEEDSGFTGFSGLQTRILDK